VALVAAEAGESGLVLGVDGSRGVITATTRKVTAPGTTATLATTGTTTSAASTATSRALGLDKARVEVNSLLDLALTLALGLAAAGGKVVLLLLLEGDGVGPLLVELAALVGLTDVEGVGGVGLLLGLLGDVVRVGDVLLLGLGGLLNRLLGGGVLLLGLGNSLGGLLVLKLSIAFRSTP